jgi:hypothetical protein
LAGAACNTELSEGTPSFLDPQTTSTTDCSTADPAQVTEITGDLGNAGSLKLNLDQNTAAAGTTWFGISSAVPLPAPGKSGTNGTVTVDFTDISDGTNTECTAGCQVSAPIDYTFSSPDYTETATLSPIDLYVYFPDLIDAALEFSFSETNGTNGNGSEIGEDVVVSYVPEPASLALFGSSLLVLGVWYQRKRKRD